MIIEALVNGKELEFTSNEVIIHKALSEIRVKMKKKFKKQNKYCEIWFTNIKI